MKLAYKGSESDCQEPVVGLNKKKKKGKQKMDSWSGRD